MSNFTLQFVTQMKLRELNRQRARLRDAYLRLAEEVAQTGSAGERLRQLYEGLRKLEFAGQTLHPEVVNLEILLSEIETGGFSPEIVSLWLRRLEDELAAGRLRAEFVYLFGALLEEWAREEASSPHLQEESQQAQEQLLQNALTEPAPNRHHEALDPLFAAADSELTEFAGRVQKIVEEELYIPVGRYDLTDVLQRIAHNIYHSPRLRREAQQFAGNVHLRKELADALTLLLSELHTWDWTEEGLTPRVLWTRNKWRLYLEQDLPTACLLEIVGDRWVSIVNQSIQRLSLFSAEGKRVKTGEAAYTPQGTLMEREFLAESDAWEENEANPFPPLPEAESVPAEAEWGSIAQMRGEYQRSLRSLNADVDYDAYGEGNRAVLLVHSEIELARAAFPARPIFVIKLDLRNYYPSIPHDVLMTILERLGVPEQESAFFARFLSPPLRGQTQPPARCRSGVPVNYTLSRLLAEMLLRLLEQSVRQETEVRIVRLVDDICLLTTRADAAVKAWNRVVEFCNACGLEINEQKSGAVSLGGDLPEGLPQNLPRWGMLELNADGHWQVHTETYDAHLQQCRERFASASSILSRVQLYNANVKYLLSSLSPGFALGETHRKATAQAIRKFHQDFFDTGQDVLTGLKEAIQKRFLYDVQEPVDIPEGWIYWPVAAGGLGLRNPLVMLRQYDEAYRRRKPAIIPKTRPADWSKRNNEWGTYYSKLLERIHPTEPAETKVMETLVEDFIARGSDISSGEQYGLNSYWRWILYTYGPQILQRFGTFRFLLTELVPMQLISHRLLQDTSLDESRQSDAVPDDIDML